MELIYQNDYGATFKIENSPNPTCQLQLVVDSVGLFMSHEDLSYLKEIVLNFDQPCECGNCNGQPCNKIWSSNPRIDICLKVEEPVLKQLEDLIKGTEFILGLDNTLEKYRLKTNLPDKKKE